MHEASLRRLFLDGRQFIDGEPAPVQRQRVLAAEAHAKRMRPCRQGIHPLKRDDIQEAVVAGLPGQAVGAPLLPVDDGL
jgi:hypothetical protein